MKTTKDNRVIAIGDLVIWHKPILCRVQEIEANTQGDKDGTPVEILRLAECTGPCDATVSLDNGHWAWIGQIEPLAKPEQLF